MKVEFNEWTKGEHSKPGESHVQRHEVRKWCGVLGGDKRSSKYRLCECVGGGVCVCICSRIDGGDLAIKAS